MRRILGTLVLVAVAVLIGTFLVRPAAVRAGHTAGLTGRTHLIVKEHNLKQLWGYESGNAGTISVGLKEMDRSGMVSSADYSVPAGRVFVINDVWISQYSSSLTLNGWITAGSSPFTSIPRWSFNQQAGGTGTTHDFSVHFSGGIAFDAGSAIYFHAANNSPVAYTIMVNGYETVDVP